MRWRTTTRTMTTLKGISALGLDRDLRFSQRHQGHELHQPHGDDEKEDDKVEDNDKDDNNNKDDNDDKGISALGLDRHQGFSRGYLEHQRN